MPLHCPSGDIQICPTGAFKPLQIDFVMFLQFFIASFAVTMMGWSSVTHPPLPFNSLSFSPECFCFSHSCSYLTAMAPFAPFLIFLSLFFSLVFSHCASLFIHESIKYWKHLPTNPYPKYTTSYRNGYLIILSWNHLKCDFDFSFSESFLQIY